MTHNSAIQGLLARPNYEAFFGNKGEIEIAKYDTRVLYLAAMYLKAFASKEWKEYPYVVSREPFSAKRAEDFWRNMSTKEIAEFLRSSTYKPINDEYAGSIGGLLHHEDGSYIILPYPISGVLDTYQNALDPNESETTTRIYVNLAEGGGFMDIRAVHKNADMANITGYARVTVYYDVGPALEEFSFYGDVPPHIRENLNPPVLFLGEIVNTSGVPNWMVSMLRVLSHISEEHRCNSIFYFTTASNLTGDKRVRILFESAIFGKNSQNIRSSECIVPSSKTGMNYKIVTSTRT